MVLAMSATAETTRISQLLGEAPIIEASHKQFPVDIRYLGGLAEPHNAARAAKQALDEQSGDVLIFLSGMGDIRRTKSVLADLGVDAQISPANRTAPPRALDGRALRPDVGHERGSP